MLVMCECPCGYICCVGLAPMDEDDAEDAAYGPCPFCPNTGANRIFSVGYYAPPLSNVTFLRVKDSVQ